MKIKKYLIILSMIQVVVLCGCSQVGMPKVQENNEVDEVSNNIEVKVIKEDPEEEVETKNPEKSKTSQKSQTSQKQEVSKKEESSQEIVLEEEVKLPEYTVAIFEEAKIMYASNPVNVRKGPTTEFERVGGLNRAQEVTVTGQADSGWYEIVYGEEKVFVSHHYLQDEKPVDEQPQQQPDQQQEQQLQEQQQQAEQQPVQAVTEVKNVAGVILVGDSRFVQMQENVGANSCTWVAENGKGYTWLSENAIPRIDGCVGKGSKILINLGVNDPGNLKNYLELVNAKAAEWVGKGAKVYYASVNPVWDNPYVTEEQVEYFNSQLQGGLSGDIHYLDSHGYLDSIGYKLVDGLHFNAETYQNLYAYYMSCL